MEDEESSLDDQGPTSIETDELTELEESVEIEEPTIEGGTQENESNLSLDDLFGDASEEVESDD